MDNVTKRWLEEADLLTEALPYINNYKKQIIVVKYGGNAMVNQMFAKSFCDDIALLQLVGIRPVIIHGGGPQISKQQEKNHIKTKFIDGFRFTTEESLEIIEMVLAKIGKDICFGLSHAGVNAISLSGKDANLIKADQQKKFGLVGKAHKINHEVLFDLIKLNYIPVISSIAVDEAGQTLNCNADDVAGLIASSLGAKRVFFLSDVPGILDKNKKQITKLSLSDAEAFAKSDDISGGMLPKLNSCISATKNGVEAAVILDGRNEHTLLLEVFTNFGSGTMIESN